MVIVHIYHEEYSFSFHVLTSRSPRDVNVVLTCYLRFSSPHPDEMDKQTLHFRRPDHVFFPALIQLPCMSRSEGFSHFHAHQNIKKIIQSSDLHPHLLPRLNLAKSKMPLTDMPETKERGLAGNRTRDHSQHRLRVFKNARRQSP